MNRRGFFGLLGKLAQVGMAMGIAPELLAPIQQAPVDLCLAVEDAPRCSPDCVLCDIGSGKIKAEGIGPTFTLAS
jgi:hypothetical protein